MTRATARRAGLRRREVGAASAAGRTDDRGGRGAPGSGSLASAIPTEPQAAADQSRAVQPDGIEHLRGLTEQARIAFEVARDAFSRLEAAHREGRWDTTEKATFLAKVAVFREAAGAVHEVAMRRREGRRSGY